MIETSGVTLPAMDADRFWSLIERARTNAGPAADQAVRDLEVSDDPDHDYWDFDELVADARAGRSGPGEDVEGAAGDAGAEVDAEAEDEDDYLTDPVAVALFDLLIEMPAAEIAAFDNQLADHRALADRDDLANAATLIEHGLLGDDAFDDFLAGLVALGRSTFEAALADPDSLADHPVVAEIAASADPRYLGREDVLYVAGNAYAAVTGEDVVSYYEFLDETRDPEATLPEPADVPEWDLTDEAATRQRLPRLAALFFERSMRIREKALANALDTLGLGDPDGGMGR
jgi:hypothetical protein